MQALKHHMAALVAGLCLIQVVSAQIHPVYGLQRQHPLVYVINHHQAQPLIRTSSSHVVWQNHDLIPMVQNHQPLAIPSRPLLVQHPVAWTRFQPIEEQTYELRSQPQKTSRGRSKHQPANGKRPPPSPAKSGSPNLRAPTTLTGYNQTTTISRRPSQARGPSGNKSKKNLVCYYGTWAVYRPDKGRFPVENIDPFICTHIIYGFTGLSYDNLIKPLDPWNDLEDNYGKGAMKRFTGLKRINPDLKTLVAIGGWNEGSVKYSKMASEPEARAKFVDSVVKFIERYDFDGLDLDWEYPGSRGGHSYDKQNFVKLLKELKQAFEPRGYLLTAAVSAGKEFGDAGYDYAQVSKYLDLINLMAYDYHGGWETKTGHNAPLFHSREHDRSALEAQLNVNWSVNYWLQMGAQPEKIMLGVGSYGRSFTLDSDRQTGFNAPASQRGQPGPYTREPGSLGYNEICEAFQREPQAWTIVRDADYLAPYAYNGRQWVGYDDLESLALKAQFAKSMGLGGMMMWSIETDDFQGSCHGQKYPLLNTLRREFQGLEETNGNSGSRPKPGSEPATSVSSSTRRPPTSSTTRKPAISSTVTPPKPDREIEGHEPRPGQPSIPARPSQVPNSAQRPRPTRPQQPQQPQPQQPPKSTTTTTSSTTTTTRRPSSSSQRPLPPSRPEGQGGNNNSNNFSCQSDGMFADPTNCRKFIRCVSNGNGYISYNFDCAPGTAFNEQQQYCDYVYNVPACRE